MQSCLCGRVLLLVMVIHFTMIGAESKLQDKTFLHVFRKADMSLRLHVL